MHLPLKLACLGNASVQVVDLLLSDYPDVISHVLLVQELGSEFEYGRVQTSRFLHVRDSAASLTCVLVVPLPLL